MFAYFGGKNQKSKWIIEHFPRNHESMGFAEVFGGAAWLTIKKPKSGKLKVYNDINGNLVNVVRVLRDHPDEFFRRFQYTLNSSELWKEAKANENTTGDDVLRAIYTVIKFHLSWGGLGNAYYNPRGINQGRDRIGALEQSLRIGKERFRNAVITRLDASDFIERFDDERMLFYVDPPYVGNEKAYEGKSEKSIHEEVAKTLKAAKGKWIVSYYDSPEIRKLYDGYSFVTKEFHLSATENRNSNNRRAEVLIMNY
jgi:DNA adenine methylase